MHPPPTSDPQHGRMRHFAPLAVSWTHHAWPGGLFDTARRPVAADVEGVLCVPYHTIFVTLSGGAEVAEVAAECGHRFHGRDFPGAVSLAPAHCERTARLKAARLDWASLSLAPGVVDRAAAGSCELRAFTNQRDPLLFGLVSELRRAALDGGGLDATYAQALADGTAHYLVRRYATARSVPLPAEARLAPRQLRGVLDTIEAHLDRPIALAELARTAGLSLGYFHRAFKATTGRTPLAEIQRRRVERAMTLLVSTDLSVSQVAFAVGFTSPSHFAAVFRSTVGTAPNAYRSGR